MKLLSELVKLERIAGFIQACLCVTDNTKHVGSQWIAGR